MHAPIRSQHADIDSAGSQLFAHLLQAYLECAPEFQDIIRRMSAIIADPESDEDDRAMATATLHEALLPARSESDGLLGFDLDREEHRFTSEAAVVQSALDAEEGAFAERVQSILHHRNMTQEQLAEALQIGQPAVLDAAVAESAPSAAPSSGSPALSKSSRKTSGPASRAMRRREEVPESQADSFLCPRRSREEQEPSSGRSPQDGRSFEERSVRALTDELRMDRDIVGLTRPLPACPAGEAVPRLRRGPSQLSVSRPLAGGPMGRQPGGGWVFRRIRLGTRSPAGQAGRGPGDPWEVGNQATIRVCSTQPLSALTECGATFCPDHGT